MNFHLQTIEVLKKLGSVANIWVCNLTHVSTLERKNIEIKKLWLWAKNNPWNKKIKINYMNKANANKIKTFEVKLALWLVPFLPPKEMLVQTLLWPKWWPPMRGKGAKDKRPNLAQLEFDFFVILFAYFAFKNSIITSRFQLWKHSKNK